jgi:hypothetical protein
MSHVADVCLALVVDLCRGQVIVQMAAKHKHKHCQIKGLGCPYHIWEEASRKVTISQFQFPEAALLSAQRQHVQICNNQTRQSCLVVTCLQSTQCPLNVYPAMTG